MSGLEIFGVVSAAATLIELVKKCSARLKAIENAHRDTAALQKRIDVLAQIVGQVSEVLHEIYRQHAAQPQISKAEEIIWERMKAVLGLCHQTLTELDIRLDHILSKTSKARPSAVPPDIKRLTDDIKTYIQALNMLKGLFQLIFQYQQTVTQHSMHRDIIRSAVSQEHRMDEILRGINQINGQLQLQQNRSDSVQQHKPFLVGDEKVERLSIHLNEIVIAATDVRASFSKSRTPSVCSLAPGVSQGSFPPSSTCSESGYALKDPFPDITHIEPLQDLAQRFDDQANADLEHSHYEDAELHQLESIECYKELHDAHSVPFDSYHDMQMKLVKIYQKLERYEDAKRIIRRAAKQPLTYDGELGSKNAPLDTSQDAKHQAVVSHDMAELLLNQFEAKSKSVPPTEDCSGDHWVLLREAESHAKRAFRIRRDIYGKDHDDCKSTALLLVRIYTKCRDKRMYMYAEIYTALYLNTLVQVSSESDTLRSRSLIPSDNSSLADDIRNHDMGAEDAVPVGVTLTELEQIIDGKSVTMIAMDCISSNQCDRCYVIVDKLLRLGVDRDAPFTYAVKRQRIKDCQFLLKHGANIDWLDSNRLTPLMHAIKQNSLEMVSYLLSHNPDINVRGERGQTALHVATHKRDEKIFKTLLKSDGLDINATDDHGLTALHLCAKQDNITFARWLHRAGANLEIKDRSGKDRTPLWIAAKEDKYNFAKTLIKWGAIVDLEALPLRGSRDMRNLLKSHQSQNAGSTSKS